MRMHAETFERFVLSCPERPWEPDRGRLREKPGMTARHGDVGRRLVRRLVLRLDVAEFSVTVRTHLHIPGTD